MKPYLKLIVFTLNFSLTVFISFAADLTDRIEIPSSPNPVGSGARALGMGGAFIAVADDATAASWNPGGLIQLQQPEFSVVGAWFHRAEDNAFAFRPESSGEQTVSESRLNYLSAAYPFTIWNRNMVVSLNYQHLYDFSREWHFPLITPGENRSDEYVDYESAGSLSAWGLAYCAEIIRGKLSFGFTLNFWEDGFHKNEWENRLLQKGTGVNQGETFAREIRSYDKYAFSGFNMNFGILWELSEKFHLGMILKTPFEAELRHKHILDSSTQYPELPPAYESETFNTFDRDAEMDMPMSYGIGFFYRFSDALWLSLDIYRTEWDDFVFRDAEGNETSPITGKSPETSDIDPTHQVRMGFEYLFIKDNYEIPLCAGVFYDPAPAEGSPDDFFGFSIGSGIGIGKFKFDLAYQYRFGNNVSGSILKAYGFSQDMAEHTLYSSLILYF